MTLEQLKEKALSLPYTPGVYIMRDKSDRVIYVGKAKKLKNRVSQYFQDTASHSPKTRLMVSNIDHFDVIIAGSEFESLVLECSLIKQHKPKYNILLKDDKGYPYIRLNMKDAYPKATVVNHVADDGAEYFGPFGSKGGSERLLKTIAQILKLPQCSKKFPKEIGKDRVCLNYHMDHCAGWCQGKLSEQSYREKILQMRQLLLGHYKSVAEDVRKEMLTAAEELNFELAASLCNQLQAVETLGKKQTVVAGRYSDVDVIGYAQTEVKACFAVLHYAEGNLVDKEYEVFPTPDDRVLAVSSLMKQYYLSRGIAPKTILIPFPLEDEELFAQLLSERQGRKVTIRVPQRGDGVRLVELAVGNASEEALRATDKEEHNHKVLGMLSKMLGIESVRRIEAYDISNISGTDNVAGMVVFEDGKPKRSAYKRFKIDNLGKQDDYLSMATVIHRRFQRYLENDEKFSVMPDLVLIDGGITHADTAVKALNELDLNANVFGMVKDDKHRTRALVTPDGRELSIDTQPAIFAFIGRIQEETHRYAISYHKKLRSKRLRYSELDGIVGIGEKRKQELLKKFKSLTAIAGASVEELQRILPRDAAIAVYDHFKNKREGEG